LKVTEDGGLTGEYWRGLKLHATLAARRDADAELSDAAATSLPASQ